MNKSDDDNYNSDKSNNGSINNNFYTMWISYIQIGQAQI